MDRNGLVGPSDLKTLSAAWGPCVDCAADLNGDGQVDMRDTLALLADWPGD